MDATTTGPGPSRSGPAATPTSAAATPGAGHGGCHCGERDTEIPQLDVRTIPHEVRHPAILGALGSLEPGRSLILVAPHEPKPLLRQIHTAYPGGFKITYVEQSPERWRLQFTRTAGGPAAT